MTFLHVGDGEDSFQIWKVAVSILNNECQSGIPHHIRMVSYKMLHSTLHLGGFFGIGGKKCPCILNNPCIINGCLGSTIAPCMHLVPLKSEMISKSIPHSCKNIFINHGSNSKYTDLFYQGSVNYAIAELHRTSMYDLCWIFSFTKQKDDRLKSIKW